MRHFIHLSIALMLFFLTNNTLFSQQSAYVVQNIPGIIEFENFDNGGEGVAYHDNDATQHTNTSFRTSERVDIYTTSDGGHKLGWNHSSEWLEYTIANITAGTYTITFRAASPHTTPGSLILQIGDGPDGSNFTQVAQITAEKTGNWDSFASYSVSGIHLDAGTNKILRADLSALDDGFDMNYVEFTLTSVTGVSVSPTSLSLEPGQTSDLTETISPSTATNKSVVWSSDDEDVATVDANGLVTAEGVGSAIITVTTNDGEYTAQCNVDVSCSSVEIPTGLSAQKGVGEVTLSWNTVDGAEGYIIRYGLNNAEDPNPYENTEEIEGGQTDIAIIDGLTNDGPTYYFVIATKIGDCISNYASEVSAIPASKITEYTNHNVYVSTVASDKNLGAGFKGIRIFGHPNLKKGFNGYTKPVNFLIDIDAPNIETDPNACLTISYDDENLPEGLNLATLDLYRFDEGTNTWTKMDGAYNAEEKSVTLCDIDEFSQWTLAGSAPESVPLKNWGIFLIIFIIAGGVVLRIFR